jgi:hypothetical protein
MKWLNAGVLEDGQWSDSGEGTPQGGSLSPLLANVYLHYVLDLWVDHWRKTQARGNVIITRFADDFIVGFQYQDDAERFLGELRGRLAKFSLELHPEKTRLIEFGPRAARDRKVRGEGKPETFTFLGSRHIARMTRQGRFWAQRITDKKKMAAKLKSVKAELMRRRHLPVPRAGTMAGQRDQGTRGVLRSPRQRGGGTGIPVPRHPALAVRAVAPQPERPGHLGADVPPGQTLPAHDQDQAPLARSAVRRQVPMTGAQCGNPARWDLRGGPPAMAVPTATNRRLRDNRSFRKNGHESRSL